MSGPPLHLRNPIARHWWLLANGTSFLLLALPLAAPLLLALGLTHAGLAIYDLFSHICHQWAHRSFFLFGHQLTYSLTDLAALVGPEHALDTVGSAEMGFKVAYCERDLAIYGSIFLAGIFFSMVRMRARPLGIGPFALLLLPILLDGGTQLLGWRESTASLRVLTGAAFGASLTWFLYPRIDIIMNRSLKVQPGPKPATQLG